MQVRIIHPSGLRDLSPSLLNDNGKMLLYPASFYDDIPFDELRYFCHVHARYGVPTQESVKFLRETIGGRPAIEIGAGNGDLGYHLQIAMTDSQLQADPDIIKRYAAMQQPVIEYPDDVEKIEALEAVKKYHPKVVIGSWITTFSKKPTIDYGSNPWGIKEKEILKRIETFILIGSVPIHGNKPIMKMTHEEVVADWIVSRSARNENRIWIWNR